MLAVITLAVTLAFYPDPADDLRKEIAALKTQIAAKEAELLKLEGKPVSPKIADLADNTDAYKGKSVTVKMRWNFRGDYTLRELRGETLAFTASEPGARADLLIDIPRDLDVPNAKDGDLLLVTFKCGGSLKKGNVATAVKRP